MSSRQGGGPKGKVTLLGDSLWVALLLLTVLTISHLHAYFGVIGRMRPALVLFGLAGVLALLQPGRVALQNLIRFWPGRVIIALGILACLSAPFGLSFGGSAGFILRSYSKTLVYAGLLIVALRGWQDVWRLVWAYVIGAGILATLSLFVVGISKTSAGATYDANDVGVFLIVGLPLAIVTLQTSGKGGKLLSALVLALSAITLARTQSRGAFVGLLVVGLGTLIALRSVSVAKRTVLMVGAAAALVLAAPKGYWDLIGTLGNPSGDYNWDSVNGRRELAKRGVGYMLDYPLFGIGINNFARAEGTISSKARSQAFGTGIRWAAPHNSFVEVGAELGVPGLLLWSSLVFGGLFSMYRVHRKLPDAWRLGDREQRFLFSLTAALPIALAGFAMTSFFVSFSYLDPIYILSAMVCGVYLTLPNQLGALEVARAATRRRTLATRPLGLSQGPSPAQ